MWSGRRVVQRAHFRSLSWLKVGVVLAHCYAGLEYSNQPHLFRTLFLERMSLPLQLTESRCEGCRSHLDALGHHRTVCTCSGKGEEARCLPGPDGGPHLPGGRGDCLEEHVCARHERRYWRQGRTFFCYGGVQFAVDITLRSVLGCEGEGAYTLQTDGVVLPKARTHKETTHPELGTSGRRKLLVFAQEGGRWSEESSDVL